MANTEAAASAAAKMAQANPTVTAGKREAGARKRIPLSVPQRKLEVPPIPGYYLRWIRGTAQRLLEAERAGFEFVLPEEVDLNNTLLGGDATHAGSTDMGSRVSVAEGAEVEGGQAVRLFLMKQKMEYYLEDKQIVQDRNDSVAASLTDQYQSGRVGGQAAGETAADTSLRYVDRSRSKIPDMFRRKSG